MSKAVHLPVPAHPGRPVQSMSKAVALPAIAKLCDAFKCMCDLSAAQVSPMMPLLAAWLRSWQWHWVRLQCHTGVINSVVLAAMKHWVYHDLAAGCWLPASTRDWWRWGLRVECCAWWMPAQRVSRWWHGHACTAAASRPSASVQMGPGWPHGLLTDGETRARVAGSKLC